MALLEMAWNKVIVVVYKTDKILFDSKVIFSLFSGNKDKQN